MSAEEFRINYGPVSRESAELGQKILEEEDAWERDRIAWVGFYWSHAKSERNAAHPFVILHDDDQWRDTHRKQRGLGLVALMRRTMSARERVGHGAESLRLRTTRYATLVSLLQDEWAVTENLRWVQDLRVAYIHYPGTRTERVGRLHAPRITDADFEASIALIKEAERAWRRHNYACGSIVGHDWSCRVTFRVKEGALEAATTQHPEFTTDLAYLEKIALDGAYEPATWHVEPGRYQDEICDWLSDNLRSHTRVMT